MKKTVYSIVLMDEIVLAVDRLAEIQGTSRSNMINSILSQYTKLSTSDKEMQTIFSHLGKILDKQRTIKAVSAQENCYTIKSELLYKYNPTITYAIELSQHKSKNWGKLRVSIRSQNKDLIYGLQDFCEIWQRLEYSNVLGGERQYTVSKGTFSRDICFPVKNASNLQLAQGLYDYIKLLDSALKKYFTAPKNSIVGQEYVDEIYQEGIKNRIIIQL